ncbi:hypothetical protein HUG17_9304 [Dermatophagoides farinae]|uniref:Uncharacterized protein n=1 Tax=Dermatophagoides farinae TaxID=6954 RepID=A0A9D4SDL0_DERFA|nr:uncharacterized protein LOC124496550 [Dermatophagoides farinae]KAH7638199.1 hypothetical protein HUG17_9304 [Dermatophagoides farinae]
MDPKSIENNDIEPTIEKKDANNETEAGFPLRLPPGFEQQLGMLSSMMQQNHGLFDQLIGGKQNQQKKDANNNNNPSTSADHEQRPDMAGKMFEQSMGMINSMFRDQGAADMFGKFFGQRTPTSTVADQPAATNVYPKLDDMDDNNKRQQQQQQPQQPKQQGQFDIETLLTQGIDRLGLKITDRNAGDLLGQLLGQVKKQQQQPSQPSYPPSEGRNFYPTLDNLDIDNNKPKQSEPTPPPPTSNQPTSPINLDNVINQGIDVIGSALKGNAGSIFGSFLKNSISTKSSTNSSGNHQYDVLPSSVACPSQPEPKPTTQPSFKQVNVEFPDDVVGSGAGNNVVNPSAPIQMPEPIRPSEPKSNKKEGGDDDDDDDRKSNKTKDGEKKILDFIPDDAFEAAFDAMAFGKK